MDIDMFIVAFKHYMRRLTRALIGVAIFTVLPLIIIAVISFIYSHNTDNEIYVNGYNMITTHISIGMLLLFQLNGGIYILSFLDNDFEKSMKWRLKSTPCPTHILAFSAALACGIIMTLQGLLVIGFTGIFMNSYWGNPLVTIIVLILTVLFSMLINIVYFFLAKSVSLAETLSWVTSSVMSAFGGFMIPLPNNEFFSFMQKYGTPFSLGQTAIKASGFLESSTSAVWISIVAMSLIIISLGGIVILLERRKLV